MGDRYSPAAYEYRETKTNFDTELSRITRIQAVLLLETSKLTETKTTENEYKKLAEKVSGENTLNHSLVDMLINRGIIYPSGRIEVEWKK